MSDPHQATPSVNSLLETLLADNDEQQYGPSSTLDIMVEKGPRWLEWDTVDFTLTEKAQTPPPSDSGHRDGWINDVEEQPPMRKQKRNFKQTGCWRDVEDGACNTILVPAQAKERQRGKNWEKAEEDILVNCKSKEMDWKSISECLQEHGYTRNHKHCADKWYALRKHYLEIHQWIVENPNTDYWDGRTSDSAERIRSVPPSFCRTWYLVFDAAENKEGKKKVANRKKGAESPRPTTAGLEFSQPSCSVRQYPGCSSGVVETQKLEFCSDGDDEPLEMLFSNRAAATNQVNFNVQVLVTEIYNLSRALTVKFAAEEEERSRSLAIKEKKLELKIQRFEFKRKRDDEIRCSVPRLRRQGL